VNEWNDKTSEITGYTKEEAFDCPLVATFIAPYMQTSVQDVLDSALQGRGTSNFELEFRTKSNEIRHLLVNATTRRDAEIDGNVNEWNRRTQEITGYSKEETFDEPLVESFIAYSMRQRVQEILDAALQGNETSNYELEFVAKSGEPRFMLVNATTRRDPEFNVVGGRFCITLYFVFSIFLCGH
jgi:PAS domain S-box-containing protein